MKARLTILALLLLSGCTLHNPPDRGHQLIDNMRPQIFGPGIDRL